MAVAAAVPALAVAAEAGADGKRAVAGSQCCCPSHA